VIYMIWTGPRNRFDIIDFALCHAFVGVIAGFFYTVCSIESTTEWARYNRQAISNGTWAQFQQFVKEKLGAYTCPSTKELISVPVKRPEADTVYEKAVVQQGNEGLAYVGRYHPDLVSKIDMLLPELEDDEEKRHITLGLTAYRITVMKERALLSKDFRSEIYWKLGQLPSIVKENALEIFDTDYAILPPQTQN
jgi:hypothetical protein